MQRVLNVLTLSPTGWERKTREPKSRKLPIREKFCNRKYLIIAIVEMYEFIFFRGNDTLKSNDSDGDCFLEKTLSIQKKLSERNVQR